LGDALTTEQWQDFDEALQEIQFKIKIDAPELTASDAVEAKMRERIAGHSVREVMRIGWETKLARLDAEGAQLETFLRMNAQAKPAGAQAAADFSNKVYTQVALLRAVDEEMERTGQKLDLLLQRPHVPHKPHGSLP